ncbi:hypothetical protein TIFTF001_027502 [Ficus carica]|uniref:Uncharacterized protein n=1 Tax=Ficus carica TaxID=3494 RepID=A0AA88DN33_FICCA|nr:hypothetical protein TIFTF001_027502 [Ficus carica]
MESYHTTTVFLVGDLPRPFFEKTDVEERARERETYRGCGWLRSGVGGGWVLRKRLEGGVVAASRGERERERCKRGLVVESQPAEMRGDRERERPKREWRQGRRENGRRGHGGGDGF